MHALMAHRDAVGDGDGAELQRVAPAGVHALLRRLRETREAQVARRDLVPRAGDADLRLVPVGVAHADGAQHAATRRGFDAIGDGA